jgi:hypothetical protein
MIIKSHDSCWIRPYNSDQEFATTQIGDTIDFYSGILISGWLVFLKFNKLLALSLILFESDLKSLLNIPSLISNLLNVLRCFI